MNKKIRKEIFFLLCFGGHSSFLHFLSLWSTCCCPRPYSIPFHTSPCCWNFPLLKMLPVHGSSSLMGLGTLNGSWPVSLRCGCTGVLWRVVGRRRERGNKLVEVQGLVESGAMGSHTGSVGRVRPLWEELGNTEKKCYPRSCTAGG